MFMCLFDLQKQRNIGEKVISLYLERLPTIILLQKQKQSTSS